MLSGSWIDSVRTSAQDPLSGTLRFDPGLGSLFASDAQSAYTFALSNYADSSDKPDARRPLLEPGPLESGALQEYEALSDRAKAQLLGFETVFLHEIIHQVDTFFSPLGGLLQVWQVVEFQSLGKVARHFAENPGLDISSPLPRLLEQSQGEVATSLQGAGLLEPMMDCLSRIAPLRTLNGIGPASIAQGWSNGTRNESVVRLPGDSEYKALTVFGSVETINLARRSGIVEPMTLRLVFETRALSACLRHIVRRFRDRPDLAASEQVRYLEAYYPGAPQEYRFVFDQLARMQGQETYEDHLDYLASSGQGIEAYDQIPTVASLCSWVALHAADPISRLLVALKLLPQSPSDVKAGGPRELLSWLNDNMPLVASDMNPLQVTSRMLDDMLVQVEAIPGGTAEHFRRMLRNCQQQLSVRFQAGSDMAHPVATPNYGNPTPWLTLDNAELLGGRYEPNEAYRLWGTVRSALIARLGDSGAKRALLDRWIEVDGRR